MAHDDELSDDIRKLTDTIHDIKTNTEILVTKLEQININIERLEEQVEALHSSSSEQERRLTVLEQMVPQNLLQDMALIKQSQGTLARFLWLVGGAAITSVANMFYNMLTK